LSEAAILEPAEKCRVHILLTLKQFNVSTRCYVLISLWSGYKKKDSFQPQNFNNDDKKILFCTDCRKYICKQ